MDIEKSYDAFLALREHFAKSVQRASSQHMPIDIE